MAAQHQRFEHEMPGTETRLQFEAGARLRMSFYLGGEIVAHAATEADELIAFTGDVDLGERINKNRSLSPITAASVPRADHGKSRSDRAAKG